MESPSEQKKEFGITSWLTFLIGGDDASAERSWVSDRKKELQKELDVLKQDAAGTAEEIEKRRIQIARLEALLLEPTKSEDYKRLDEKFTKAVDKGDMNSVKEHYFRGANVNAIYG